MEASYRLVLQEITKECYNLCQHKNSGLWFATICEDKKEILKVHYLRSAASTVVTSYWFNMPAAVFAASMITTFPCHLRRMLCRGLTVREGGTGPATTVSTKRGRGKEREWSQQGRGSTNKGVISIMGSHKGYWANSFS